VQSEVNSHDISLFEMLSPLSINYSLERCLVGFEFDKTSMYMMPVNFGPSVGPRRKPDGKRFIYDNPTKIDRYGVVYEVEDPKQLEALLPEGMTLKAPYLIVVVDYLSDIAWLGKKQYALMTCNIPVRVKSDEGNLKGFFLACIWENEIDPIITGREQLGFCKIPCEIDPPQREGNKVTIRIAEYGNEFLKLEIEPGKLPNHILKFLFAINQGDGIFHYKYMPRAIAPFDEPEVNCLCFSPRKFKMPEDFSTKGHPKGFTKLGRGTAKWTALTWEQSPCHYRIIKTLSNIKITRFLGSANMQLYSANDYYYQRIIKRY